MLEYNKIINNLSNAVSYCKSSHQIDVEIPKKNNLL